MKATVNDHGRVLGIAYDRKVDEHDFGLLLELVFFVGKTYKNHPRVGPSRPSWHLCDSHALSFRLPFSRCQRMKFTGRVLFPVELVGQLKDPEVSSPVFSLAAVAWQWTSRGKNKLCTVHALV